MPGTSNNRYLPQPGVALRTPLPPTGVTPALLRNKTIHIHGILQQYFPNQPEPNKNHCREYGHTLSSQPPS